MMNSNDPYRPRELVEHRKEVSDRKNMTDKLTFDSSNNNTRAAAYKSIRDMKDDDFIKALSRQTDEDEMLAELAMIEKEYINEPR